MSDLERGASRAGESLLAVSCAPSDDFARLSRAARDGCGESLGQLIERCRNYLLLVANRGLDADLRAKIGASDLVQETLLAAQRGFDRFDGTSEEELRYWLRRILLNKLASSQRKYYRTAKRQLSRELPLPAGSDSQSDRVDFVDPEVTPRARVLADEQAWQIEQVLEQLPDRDREVIELRCFDRKSFVETGQILHISPEAARKRWCRAIERLRQQLESNDESR